MDDWRCMVWSNPGASCKVSYTDKLVIWTHWQAFSTIARHIASASSASKAILIDCFAGVGGNVIAFAQSERWKRIYAIEKDPRALACAKHNAEIYGVRDRISWYEGDCFEILKTELVKLGPHSIVFASPPWGGKLFLVRYKASLTIAGPGYRSDSVFDLAKMQPYTLTDLLYPFQQLTEDVVLYLPRTSDVRQLANKSSEGSKTIVMHYCMEGASKVGRTYRSLASNLWLNHRRSAHTTVLLHSTEHAYCKVTSRCGKLLDIEDADEQRRRSGGWRTCRVNKSVQLKGIWWQEQRE